MAQWTSHLRKLGMIGGLTLGIAAMAASVAAQDWERSSGASEAAAVGTPVGTRPRLPLIPWWVKLWARYDPAAPSAEVPPSAPDIGPFTADVVTSFGGLHMINAVNHNRVSWPPDTNMAKSPLRFVEVVNSAIRLSGPRGGVLATADLNTFFGAPITDFPDNKIFDPKVYYDRNPTNPRFYVVALRKNPGATSAAHVSQIHLAVSKTPNPSNLTTSHWCRYSIEGRHEMGTPNVSWADYPGLGVGEDKLVITANQFTFGADAFRFATIRVLNKLTLAANRVGFPCPALPPVNVNVLTPPATAAGDLSIFTLQPVQHYTSPPSCPGASNPVYLINTNRNGNVADYRVWRVANPAPSAILQGPVTLAGAANYTIPPNARQSGSSDRLDTGDVRVLQAAGTGNLIEGVHSTGCALGGGENESCVRYVRFNVGCTDTDGIAAAFDQQFTFGGGDGDFFFWPGTARNIDGQSGIAFQRSSAETFLSAAWCVKPADGTCTIVSNFTTGTCAQDPLLENRTGDYVGAHTDGGVNFKDFCFGGERAVPLTLGDERLCLWQTWITCVRPGDDVVEPGLAWQQEGGGEADASGPPSLLSP